MNKISNNACFVNEKVIAYKREEVKIMLSETEKGREARRKYYKDWRKRNPDKVRQYNIKYWKNRALREMEGGADNAETAGTE